MNGQEKTKPNTLAIVLAVFLVAAIAYIVMLKVKPNDEGEGRTTTASTEIDPDLVNYWKTMKKEIDPDATGEFILYHKAVINAFKYRDQRNGEALLKKEPYGFAFGRRQLRRFLDNIDDLNKKLGPFANPLDSIQGVRVYFVRTETELNANTKKEHFDVMMIPARGTGANFIPIGDEETGKTILDELNKKGLRGDILFLNTSAPCPDLCDGTGGL
jgi:hypothetical protein